MATHWLAAGLAGLAGWHEEGRQRVAAWSYMWRWPGVLTSVHGLGITQWPVMAHTPCIMQSAAAVHVREQSPP